MTDLQILRASLFDEIARVKRGTALLEDTKSIIASANAITQSYNTELKACEIMLKAQELGGNLPDIQIFNEVSTENIIEYKAKDGH